MEQIMPQVTDDDGESHVSSITFVDDSTVEIIAAGEVPDQKDGCDTPTPSLTRSGRAIRAHFRLDL